MRVYVLLVACLALCGWQAAVAEAAPTLRQLYTMPPPTAADETCGEGAVALTRAQLVAAMGITQWQEASWCANTKCDEVLAELNEQLPDAYMACPLRMAVFLAQVRHETAALTQMLQPIDNGAGLLHMLPNNFRRACEDMPTLAVAFRDEFLGKPQYCDASRPCWCGSNAGASEIVARPEFAVATAVWWLTAGASRYLGPPCTDVRASMDDGEGYPNGDAYLRQMTGFHRVSHCIFGFVNDNGISQRVTYFNDAVRALGADPPPTAHIVTPTEAGLVGGVQVVTIDFTESIPEMQPEHVTVSRGEVTAVAPVQWRGNMKYEVRVGGLTPGQLTVTVPAGVVVDSTGHANPFPTSATFAVEDAPPQAVDPAGGAVGGAQEQGGQAAGPTSRGCDAACVGGVAGGCVAAVVVAIAVLLVHRWRRAVAEARREQPIDGAWGKAHTVVQIITPQESSRRSRGKQQHGKEAARKTWASKVGVAGSRSSVAGSVASVSTGFTGSSATIHGSNASVDTRVSSNASVATNSPVTPFDCALDGSGRDSGRASSKSRKSKKHKKRKKHKRDRRDREARDGAEGAAGPADRDGRRQSRASGSPRPSPSHRRSHSVSSRRSERSARASERGSRHAQQREALPKRRAWDGEV